MSKKIVIFDIDGTLSDCSERREELALTKDFYHFEANCGIDKPNKSIIDLLNSIALSRLFSIYIVSGRKERYREMTVDWLYSEIWNSRYSLFHQFDGMHLPLYDSLLMRADDDNRCDTEVKREMVKYFKDQILFVVDDRQKVVDMWRSLGITCLQCADFKG